MLFNRHTLFTENTTLFLQEQTVFTIKADKHSPVFLVVQESDHFLDVTT